MVLEDTLSPTSSNGSLDSSIDRCTSPETSSSDMSVSSNPDSYAVTSPRVGKDQPAKKVRTSYTREQTLALMKIFEENPYPDHEKMENIGNELDIPVNKLKIWFQNRRARTRRKDSVSTFDQPPMGISHVTPALPYGYLPTTHMLSSPSSVNPGYFNGYPWMPSVTSPNNNYQMFAHYNHPRLQSPRKNAPMATCGYHTGYSHLRNAPLSQQSQNSAIFSRTSEKHMGSAGPAMSQQYNKVRQFQHVTSPQCQRQSAQQATTSLLTTQQKDARPAFGILPATSNYGISQLSIYSWPYHSSIIANQKNSVDQNIC